MQIKDLPEVGASKPRVRIKYHSLAAYHMSSGKHFWAESFDGNHACSGIILNYSANDSSDDKKIQVNDVWELRK